MAVVAEGDRGRVYLDPADELIVRSSTAEWRPTQDLPRNPRWFSPPDYGMPTYADLFTERQLMALTTFSDLVTEAQEMIAKDALGAGLSSEGDSLAEGGTDARAYAEAVGVYLGLSVSRQANRSSSLTFWHIGEQGR